MEPMALGSPAGSPSTGSPSNYLPSYLMGESNISVTPRNNTLSPTKGRTLAFGECVLFKVQLKSKSLM